MSHRGANGSGVVVRNIKAIFFGDVAGLTRPASWNNSELSSSTCSCKATGGGGVMVVGTEEEVRGVVIVKIIARGKQSKTAQRREIGEGESMMWGVVRFGRVE
ncbi:hypothetical protein K7X08_034066 [Anisodus acutangulus]|uniref:Uncharacterized protein n=1 Tax=Anisodus acutangulus TaxID=402998 RepID=A0A9Q1RIN3_9SOLA|nr:hypothetical protein K7X08_034066 [Anisodus acutangulus]